MGAFKKRPTGLTREVGFRVDVRKTIPVKPEIAWEFLISKEGIAIWVGKINHDKMLSGEYFQTPGGDEGKIRLVKPYSHIRLNWKPRHWENLSTMQLTIIPNKNKTTIRFHHEKLKNTRQRKEMREHWQKILKQLYKEMKYGNKE